MNTKDVIGATLAGVVVVYAALIAVSPKFFLDGMNWWLERTGGRYVNHPSFNPSIPIRVLSGIIGITVLFVLLFVRSV